MEWIHWALGESLFSVRYKLNYMNIVKLSIWRVITLLQFVRLLNEVAGHSIPSQPILFLAWNKHNYLCQKLIICQFRNIPRIICV
jgi:hypothetical protein